MCIRDSSCIGDYAFKACYSLTGITLGDAVTGLGDNVFYNCYRLSSATLGNGLTNMGNLVFNYCYGLTNVTIGNGLATMGNYCFNNCTGLRSVYFQGNAPVVNGVAGTQDQTTFPGIQKQGTVYYALGTTGWGATFGNWPTAGWYDPQPQIHHHLGHGGSGSGSPFGFSITWATNTSVVVEASTDLVNWTAISTNTLINGTNDFSDPDTISHQMRFYRVHAQ